VNRSSAMTCKDMLPAIGSRVAVRFEDLTIACTISDVKISWAAPRLLITPVSGVGQQWVELSRVVIQSSRETSYMIAR
jgi:hypothetical protein